MCTEVLRCDCLVYSSFFAGRVGEGVVVDQPLLVGWILSCRSILGVFFFCVCGIFVVMISPASVALSDDRRGPSWFFARFPFSECPEITRLVHAGVLESQLQGPRPFARRLLGLAAQYKGGDGCDNRDETKQVDPIIV